jgi:hypothetical protein
VPVPNAPAARHVDEQDHGREREAEVAEHLDREVPLAVPFHRVTRDVERLDRVEDLEPITLGQRQPPIGLFTWRMA